MSAPARELRRQIARVVKTARGNMGRSGVSCGASLGDLGWFDQHGNPIKRKGLSRLIYVPHDALDACFYGVGLGELLMRSYERAQARIWWWRFAVAAAFLLTLLLGVWLAVL